MSTQRLTEAFEETKQLVDVFEELLANRAKAMKEEHAAILERVHTAQFESNRQKLQKIAALEQEKAALKQQLEDQKVAYEKKVRDVLAAHESQRIAHEMRLRDLMSQHHARQQFIQQFFNLAPKHL